MASGQLYNLSDPQFCHMIWTREIFTNISYSKNRTATLISFSAKTIYGLPGLLVLYLSYILNFKDRTLNSIVWIHFIAVAVKYKQNYILYVLFIKYMHTNVKIKYKQNSSLKLPLYYGRLTFQWGWSKIQILNTFVMKIFPGLCQYTTGWKKSWTRLSPRFPQTLTFQVCVF